MSAGLHHCPSIPPPKRIISCFFFFFRYLKTLQRHVRIDNGTVSAPTDGKFRCTHTLGRRRRRRRPSESQQIFLTAAPRGPFVQSSYFHVFIYLFFSHGNHCLISLATLRLSFCLRLHKSQQASPACTDGFPHYFPNESPALQHHVRAQIDYSSPPVFPLSFFFFCRCFSSVPPPLPTPNAVE